MSNSPNAAGTSGTVRGGAGIISGLGALAFVHGGALASAPPKIVGFGPDLITVLTAAPVKDKRSGLLVGAELQGEVTSETVAAANGWRSMRAVMDISCADRRDRVRSMTVFSDHNGKGEERTLTPPTDWIAPSQNTGYGVAVVNYFCGGAGSRLIGAGVARKPSLTQSPEKTPTAKASPDESEIGAEHAQTIAPTSPTAAVPEDDATTNGMGVIEAATAPNERDAKHAPNTAAAAKRPAAPGPFAVQVGSATTEADARSIFDRLKIARADLPAGRQLHIEPAEVSGQRHYRALVVGFPDATSAAHFCDRLKTANGCIVRRAP